MVNKFGSYIQKLMATVVDKEQEEFIVSLAIGELKKINSDINEFLLKHQKDDFKEREKTEKQLLQEEKNNVKDK